MYLIFLGLVWVKFGKDGAVQSGVGKFFGDDDLKAWGQRFDAVRPSLVKIRNSE